MPANLLYLRGGAVRGIYGGADVVSASIARMLKEYYGPDCITGIYMDELEPRPGRLRSFARLLTGRFPLYSPKALEKIKAGIASGAVLLFVDQSVYGLACAEAKALYPRLPVVCLFHNVERRYFRRSARHAKRLHELLLLPSVTRAEKAAIKHADLIITLSGRDSQELYEDYGRRAELILPPIVADEGRVEARVGLTAHNIVYAFIGSAFAPNLEGARWFKKEVLPFVPGRFLLAGRGFEAYAQEFQGDRVEVLGFVPSLKELYARADIIVSPIFWGSGIKVKTAEAFQYGMPFIGTAESLEGYAIASSGALLANDAQGFIRAITELEEDTERKKSGNKSRGYYEAALSYKAVSASFFKALDGLGAGSKIIDYPESDKQQ